MIPRREFLRTSAVAGGSLLGACAVDAVPRGRVPVSLWFSYGGTNREVLEALVRRFNSQQNQDYVQAGDQGGYFEGLAQLRPPIAPRRAPPLSHRGGGVGADPAPAAPL